MDLLVRSSFSSTTVINGPMFPQCEQREEKMFLKCLKWLKPLKNQRFKVNKYLITMQICDKEKEQGTAVLLGKLKTPYNFKSLGGSGKE